MAKILEFGVGARSINWVNLRNTRKEMGLSLSQAAAALSTSPATLEIWERNPGMGPNVDWVIDKFQSFVHQHGVNAGKNLIFGHYSLRMARELLGLSITKIAERYGYKPSAWQKLESNTRPLAPEKIALIEEDVRAHFARICESA